METSRPPCTCHRLRLYYLKRVSYLSAMTTGKDQILPTIHLQRPQQGHRNGISLGTLARLAGQTHCLLLRLAYLEWKLRNRNLASQNWLLPILLNLWTHNGRQYQALPLLLPQGSTGMEPIPSPPGLVIFGTLKAPTFDNKLRSPIPLLSIPNHIVAAQIWGTAAKAKVNSEIPWKVLCARLVWHIWTTRCKDLYNAHVTWTGTICVARRRSLSAPVATGQELQRHKRTPERHRIQFTVDCDQVIQLPCPRILSLNQPHWQREHCVKPAW